LEFCAIYSSIESLPTLKFHETSAKAMTKVHRNSVDPEVTAKTGSGTPAQFRANVVPRLHVMVHRAGPRGRFHSNRLNHLKTHQGA
jgi:hypothetical protein